VSWRNVGKVEIALTHLVNFVKIATHFFRIVKRIVKCIIKCAAGLLQQDCWVVKDQVL
jgi:hypothetical protein